ncbi:TCDD-inducible poly ADP-ribose polymerase [Arapaima gigas]
MEKILQLLQEPVDSGDRDSDLSEQRGRQVDKIPLVKPHFKKKHCARKLESKCLRTLENPILTTLLSSDALVASDGVFITQNPVRPQGALCATAVEKQEPVHQGCLKEDSAGHGDVSAEAGRDISEDGAQKAADVREGAAAPGDDPFREAAAPGALAPSGGTRLADGDGQRQGEMFEDKSDEASLDLVFELLTQLQYHTHAGDGVAICADFLRGICAYGSDCARHHTVLPYHWQIRSAESRVWQSISDESQEQLERLYCNPDNEQVHLRFHGRIFTLDFNTMRVSDLEFDLVRRLSTPTCSTTTAASSTATPPGSSSTPGCHTVWKYYCRDNFGWREYSEPVVRLIEEASGRGLKEVRFITLQNQYILNIREGFQQNAIFGFRRQIKKRPLFVSSVVLLPHLQTLSGLASLQAPTPPLPLSPTPSSPSRVYPETWVPMSSYQDFVQVPVAKEDRSYRTVYSLFHKTVSETKFRILRILRVQNPFLWEKYKRKKEYMSRRMSEMDRMLNERHLFHGTSQDVVEGICKHNFDPRVCGKHATMFGQGSYFARKAVYSHNFSKRSAKGVHCMFLAKVLTGRFTLGNPSMRRPPPLSPRDPSSDLYDSCVDNWLDPQIFVIFNDDQSYPYFIIQYEEVSSTVPV